LPRRRASATDGAAAVVLPDPGLLRPGDTPWRPGSPRADGADALGKLRDAVSRGDPGAALLRQVSGRGRDRLSRRRCRVVALARRVGLPAPRRPARGRALTCLIRSWSGPAGWSRSKERRFG